MHHLIYLHRDFYFLIYCPLIILKVFLQLFSHSSARSNFVLSPNSATSLLTPFSSMYQHTLAQSQTGLDFHMAAQQFFLSLPLNQLFTNTSFNTSFPSCYKAVGFLSAFGRTLCRKKYTEIILIQYMQLKAGLLSKKALLILFNSVTFRETFTNSVLCFY